MAELLDAQNAYWIRLGTKTTVGHNSECRERILARVREAEADRGKDFDERHIRRAIWQRDAQIQVEQWGSPGDEQVVLDELGVLQSLPVEGVQCPLGVQAHLQHTAFRHCHLYGMVIVRGSD